MVAEYVLRKMRAQERAKVEGGMKGGGRVKRVDDRGVRRGRISRMAV